MRVRVITPARHAVLMLDEDDANENGASDKRCQHGRVVLLDRSDAFVFELVGVAEGAWQRLDGREIDVRAATEGEDQAGDLVGDVNGGDDDTADDHTGASDKVPEEGHLGGKANVVGEEAVIANFLSDLMVHGRSEDAPGERLAAHLEREADGKAVDEVVREVADADREEGSRETGSRFVTLDDASEKDAWVYA